MHLDFGSGNPNLVMALAGNKADLEDKRKVSAEASDFCLILCFLLVIIFISS